MKQINLQENLRKKFIKSGVKMTAPETVFFSKDTKIGKNVTIDPYVVIGEKVNIGAGTITCNYDGVNKAKTIIGDNAFIGSNSSLVAPVNIGATATVGAGSVITSTVEDEQLAIARSKQRNLTGWKRPVKK